MNIIGYKVVADENANPGRYAFKIIHETDKTHFFSSDQHTVVREWMKAIMKATIGRDFSSECIDHLNPSISLLIIHTCIRTSDVIMQHSNNPTHGGASYEPGSPTTIANGALRDGECSTTIKSEQLVEPRCARADGTPSAAWGAEKDRPVDDNPRITLVRFRDIVTRITFPRLRSIVAFSSAKTDEIQVSSKTTNTLARTTEDYLCSATANTPVTISFTDCAS